MVNAGDQQVQKSRPLKRLFSDYLTYQACWVNFQVTPFPPYGGITLPLAMGAVVEGVPTTFQIPLSGHFCPVEAVVPIGALDILIPLLCFIRIAFCVAIRISGLEISFQEVVEVIFYKSDTGRTLTEIVYVCGVVNFGIKKENLLLK